MRYLKPLTTGTMTLAVLATVATSTAAGQTLSSDTSSEPVDRRAVTEVAGASDVRETDDEAGRLLGELTPQDRPPEWLDQRDDPRAIEGGTSGGPAGSPDSYKAGPWCNSQCITKGVAYQYGSGVQLVVNTSVPASIYLAVVHDDDGDGNFELGEFYEYEFSNGLVTQFSWVLQDLIPGEKYYVSAIATDMYDNTSYAQGSFTLPS